MVMDFIKALEAKEKIEIQNENQTLHQLPIKITLNYIKNYQVVLEQLLTESQKNFLKFIICQLYIPTNKEMIRKDWNDQIFRTEKEKDNAIIEKIKECNEIGQPLLVFTSSINKSEHYSDLLEKKKLNIQF